VCTIGPETYNKTLQKGKVVISLPIFDTNGNVAAVITLAYYREFSQTIEEEELFSWLIAWQFSIAKKIHEALTLAQHKILINIDNSILHTTFSMIDEGFIFLDYNGQINHISRGGEHLLGMTSAKAKGKYYSDFFGELPQIADTLQGKLTVPDIPDIAATVSNRHGSKACNLKVKPLIINKKEVVGAVIRITELNKTIIESDKSKFFPAKFTFDDILGNSPELLRAKQLAKKVASRDLGVLLIGETGSGKELFAQAIHNESHPNKPFVAINCASIPTGLIESELFGYEGGSFTGAEPKGRAGKIEMANGGTLFLDEIGDMPLESQATLLRVLEDRRIMRLGGNKYIPADFRVIAATNKNLYAMALQKEFRADLYFRLATFKITVPSLPNRGDDMITLARFFIEQQCMKLDIPKLELDTAVLRILIHYHWPGNVRQLKNAMDYAVNMAENGTIRVCDLPDEIIDNPALFSPSGVIKPIREQEQQSIIDAMILTNNDLYQAAAMLGLSKSTLYRRLKEYKIQLKDTM
ncbi:MAG: sigma54 specific transcriptional regulator, partial [Pelosinus sp.]|nr:sigma54 specific transcriptional regulator [Pelosinus sp.]